MHTLSRPYWLVLCLLFSFRLQVQAELVNHPTEVASDKRYFDSFDKGSALVAFSDSIPGKKSIESPYQLKWQKELILVGTELAVNTGSYLIYQQIKPLREEYIKQLNSSDVWAPDRGATRHYSANARHISDLLVTGSAVAPGVFLLNSATRRDFGKIAAMQFETMLAVNGLVILTKGLAKRTRPLVFNPNVPLVDKLTIDARQSFFSGHVANAAATSFFLASTFSQYFPESRLKPLVWTYAIACPAVTGYCRYRGGKHYLSDIVVGYVVGAATGVLIPKIHQKLSRKRRVIP